MLLIRSNKPYLGSCCAKKGYLNAMCGLEQYGFIFSSNSANIAVVYGNINIIHWLAQRNIHITKFSQFYTTMLETLNVLYRLKNVEFQTLCELVPIAVTKGHLNILEYLEQEGAFKFSYDIILYSC